MKLLTNDDGKNLRFTAPTARPLPEPISPEQLESVRQRTAPPRHLLRRLARVTCACSRGGSATLAWGERLG